MSTRMKYSQNNSVVFSRISAILGVGNPSGREVYDGETIGQKSMFHLESGEFMEDKAESPDPVGIHLL